MDATRRDAVDIARVDGANLDPPASSPDAETRSVFPSQDANACFPSPRSTSLPFGAALPARGAAPRAEDTAPSPSSPCARDPLAAARRAKTPPTFADEPVGDRSLSPTPQTEGLNEPARENDARVFQEKNVLEGGRKHPETRKTKTYPLSFLFPEGKLYRDDDCGARMRKTRVSGTANLQPGGGHQSQEYEIPEDYERLAVDADGPKELRRLARLRGTARIAKFAAAAARRGNRKARRTKSREDDEDDEDEDDEDDDDDDDDDEDEDEDEDATPLDAISVDEPNAATEKVSKESFEGDWDADFHPGPGSAPLSISNDGFANPRERSRKKRAKLTNLDSARADIMTIASFGRPRMRLGATATGSPSERRGPNRIGGAINRPEDALVQDGGFKTPVKGFRTPRTNESATFAASMFSNDRLNDLMKTPPRPVPFAVGSVVVVAMGSIDPKRSVRSASASSYILPVGFTSRRKYGSVSDPDRRVWYESRVEADDEPLSRDGRDPEKKQPPPGRTADPDGSGVRVVVFECEDSPESSAGAIVFAGPSPTHAWQQVIRAVNETARTRKRSSVSGPQFLGLSSPVVAAEIAKLPGYARARAELERRRK